jgi:Xaa-Pro aminopeptidase
MTDLPPMDVRARAERLAARAADAELDGLLVTRAQNILYLTGFTGAASLLVTSAGLTLVTDGRYAEQAVDQLANAGVAAAIEVGRSERDRRALLLSATQGLRRLGLEAEHVSWSTQRALADTLTADTQLVPSSGLDVHELPWLQHRGEAMLRPGHVITIEPGVYLPEHGGVRVEDMLLVTSDGSRVLTNSPKEWMV